MQFSALLLTGASVASAAVIDVTVGAGGKLAFVPSTITAAIGDTVVFSYYPSSHSVAEGVFTSACTPATDGFFSGLFSTTAAEVINPNIFTITIDTLDPTVFYCSSGKHCASGMVGVINPNSTITEALYAAAAVGKTTTAPTTVGGGVISAA